MTAVALAVGAWADSSPAGAAASPASVSSASPTGPARTLPVATAAVTLEAGFESVRTYSGELRPRRAASLGFEAAGRIERVAVDEGDRVEAGALLAELESDRVRASRDAVLARREREQARLDELIEGPRAQTIAVARAEVRSLEQSLQLAELQSERRRQLVIEDAASREEHDVAATRVETTDADLEAARARLDELEEGTRVETIDQQKALVRELDAEIAGLDIQLADRRLIAPFAGVVTLRAFDEGAVVDAGTSLLRIIERDALEVRFGLPLEQATELATGATLPIEVRGRTFDATVRALVPEMDGATRTVDAILTLDQETSRMLVTGDVARLELGETVRAEGAWVPTTALVPGARGRWAGYAITEDAQGRSIVERRELEVVHTTGDRAYVRGLLRDGELLLTEGAHRVVPGQLVKPVR